MVIKNTNIDSSPNNAYVSTDVSTSLKSEESIKNLTTVVTKYDNFIRSFDGSDNAAKKVEDLIDDLCHPDFTILANGKERDIEFFKYTLFALASAHHRTQDISVSIAGGNTVRIEFDVVSANNEGDALHVDRLVNTKDGKVLHSRPTSIEDDTFAEYTRYVPIERVAIKYGAWVESSFDGKPRDEIEASMDELFSPDFVIVAGGKERDLEFFKGMVVKASASPLRSRINAIDVIDRNHIHVNFSLLVAGLNLFAVDRILTVDEDRILRFEPAPGHRDVFSEVKKYLFPGNRDKA
ncbi:hypothetical protein ACHAWF_006317 [Thalassiosira exigua]